MEYDYSPEVRPYEESSGGRLIAERIHRDRRHIEKTIAKITSFKNYLGCISADEDVNDAQQPYWNNTWLPALDASILYALVADGKPQTYLEIGSGNSTKFVRRAIRDHDLDTRIISVDPHPRAEVDALCDDLLRTPIEKLDIEALAKRLRSGDIVFIDNSHRGFQNSDVTVCFTELLPALPPGVRIGIHDICLPFDYVESFKNYFYNEQYYLTMYLLGGAAGDMVLLPSFYACREPGMEPLIAKALDHPGIPPATRGGTSFWLEVAVGHQACVSGEESPNKG